LREGEENFFNHYISPNFRCRELKIYEPLDVDGPLLVCEFRDPSPENGVWEDDRRKKFNCFGG